MKKHLAVVCGVLYPNPSATGICTQRYIELLTDEYDIDVICIASDMKSHEVELPSGIRVHAIAGGTHAMESICTGIAKWGWHLMGQMQIKLHRLGNMQWFASAASEELEYLCQRREVDIVFSVCSPMAAHCAAQNFHLHHPQVHWVAYTVDYYATPQRIRPFFMTQRQLAQWELETLKEADSVLLSEEIYRNHYEIVECLSWVRALPYLLPDISMCDISNLRLPKDKINCVFAGSFYSSIRNPELMLKSFASLREESICLHLFSTGCEEIVEKFADDKRIILHGRVPYSAIQDVLQQADVLINIGNNNSDFIPSKTYEYIAWGKPIINFFYGKKPDSVLAHYPTAFHVCNTSDFTSISELKNFIHLNVGRVLARETIEMMYYKNTAISIRDILIQALKIEKRLY